MQERTERLPCYDACFFLPRPWMEVDQAEVRTHGAAETIERGQHLYVKGEVAPAVLSYWHRVVFKHEVLPTVPWTSNERR